MELRRALSGLGGFARHVAKPVGTWTNPQAQAPARADGLKVVSYNVMVKGKHLDALARDLAAMQGDVVCLQECSEATARALGQRLGLHVAYHEHPLHSYGGTATLSRYPITHVAEHDLVNPWGARLGQFWTSLKAGKPRMAALDSRHLIHVRLKVGAREVDVLNGHLTVFGAETNAKQIAQITRMAQDLRAQGRTVVAAGDWNADFNDVRPAAQAAVQDLRAHFGDWWEAPTRTATVGGQVRPADAAGVTTLGSQKRLDNVFFSRDLRAAASHIDQTTRASDHQPISTDLRWEK